jgi:hypothetical protein
MLFKALKASCRTKYISWSRAPYMFSNAWSLEEMGTFQSKAQNLENMGKLQSKAQ